MASFEYFVTVHDYVLRLMITSDMWRVPEVYDTSEVIEESARVNNGTFEHTILGGPLLFVLRGFLCH
jgi:hypothetical protein